MNRTLHALHSLDLDGRHGPMVTFIPEEAALLRRRAPVASHGAYLPTALGGRVAQGRRP